MNQREQNLYILLLLFLFIIKLFLMDINSSPDNLPSNNWIPDKFLR